MNETNGTNKANEANENVKPRGPLSRLGINASPESSRTNTAAAIAGPAPQAPSGQPSRVPSPRSRVQREHRKVARAVFSVCAVLVVLELIWPGVLEAPFLRAWYGQKVVASLDTTEARTRGVFIRSFTIDPSLPATGQAYVECAWLERASVRTYTSTGVLALKGTQRAPHSVDRVPPSLLCVRISNPGKGISGYELTSEDGRRTAFHPHDDDFDVRFHESKRVVFLAPIGRSPYRVKLTGPTGETSFELR